jgi:hypothetical protein
MYEIVQKKIKKRPGFLVLPFGISKINNFLFFIQWLVCCLNRLLVQLAPARRLPHRLQPAARQAFSLAEGLLSGRKEVSHSHNSLKTKRPCAARTCLFSSLTRKPLPAHCSFAALSPFSGKAPRE